MRTNKNVYSEYTLRKIKNFIIKNVDKIKLIGGDMHLYMTKKENLRIIIASGSVSIYYSYSNDYYNELIQLEKKLYK